MKWIPFVLLSLITGLVQGQKQPNIVFIMIDDLGYTDLGYMGSPYYETPNIDRLAAGGMVFTNAYTNAANCAPTRASLISGQYSPRHHVFTVGKSDRGNSKDRRLIPVKNQREISLDKITIAESLKKAGYSCAAIGKWHVGHTPQEQGFDYAIDRHEMQINGHFHNNGDYLTDLLTSKAIGFIERNNPKNTHKPFFLYLSHHAVHTPIQAKKDLVSYYEEKEGIGCHNHQTYAAMIQSVDQSVMRIQRTLDSLNLSDNTLVIFFSDNGGHGTYTCQEPLRGGKGMYYEGGIRVPMFAYWAGTIKAGKVCHEPVIGVDFYPTFLALAGVSKPESYPLDGANIGPLFDGRNMKRKSIFWHFPAYLQAYEGLRNASRDPTFRTRPVSVIRSGKWKLLQFHEEWVLDGGLNGNPGSNSLELYNLKKDIGEQQNLVLRNPSRSKKLLRKLRDWQFSIRAPIPKQANPDFRKS